MEPEFGLRREAGPDLEAIGSDPALEARVRDGPMPFVRFMELALYDPDGGYYRGSAARPGRAGDFLTAPELHPIFGQTLATAVDEIRIALGDPRPFTIREYGAGTGALARPLLAGLRARAPAADLRYQPIDVDRRRLDDLATTLADAGSRTCSSRRRPIRSTASSWPTRSSTRCRSTASEPVRARCANWP